MLIFFTCPRGFINLHNLYTIQKNAILSWKNLNIDKKIVLVGDEDGSKEFCEKYDLIYEPNVEKNQWNTPLINSIFEIGISYGDEDDIFCYINTDIILENDFVETLNNLDTFIKENDKYLLSGIRHNIYEIIDIEIEINWKNTLNQIEACSPGAIDYFIFSKSTYDVSKIPPFGIGKLAFDNWLISYSVINRIPSIDCSNTIKVYHQMAPWQVNGKFIERDPKQLRKNEEVKQNIDMFKKSTDIKPQLGTLLSLQYELDENYNLVANIKRVDIPQTVSRAKAKGKGKGKGRGRIRAKGKGKGPGRAKGKGRGRTKAKGKAKGAMTRYNKKDFVIPGLPRASGRDLIIPHPDHNMDDNELEEILDYKVYTSLTSIYQHQDILLQGLKSILEQSRLPDKCYIYLSEEPYLKDVGFKDKVLSDKLKQFIGSNDLFEIRWCKNLGPYRKLLPILKEKWEEDCLIITLDDDIVYHRNLIENLVYDYHQQKCCINYRGFTLYFENSLLDTIYEKRGVFTQRSLYNFSCNGAGTVFHPTFFHKTGDLIFNEEMIKEYVETTDDVWYNFCRMANGIELYLIGKPYIVKDNHSQNALFINYNGRGRKTNTKNIRRLSEKFIELGYLDDIN